MIRLSRIRTPRFPRVTVRASERQPPEMLPAGSVITKCMLMRRTEEITRRKWLTRRIRYPMIAHFLHISRILRVNPAGRAAGGAAVNGVTGPGGKAAARAQAGLDRHPGGQATGPARAFRSGAPPLFRGFLIHDRKGSGASDAWCGWSVLEDLH